METNRLNSLIILLQGNLLIAISSLQLTPQLWYRYVHVAHEMMGISTIVFKPD